MSVFLQAPDSRLFNTPRGVAVYPDCVDFSNCASRFNSRRCLADDRERFLQLKEDTACIATPMPAKK